MKKRHIKHIMCDTSSSPFQTDMTSSTFRIEPVYTGLNYYVLTYLSAYLLTSYLLTNYLLLTYFLT